MNAFVEFTLKHFNPRSREGSDIRKSQANTARTDFNPRSREGSDPNRSGFSYLSTNFNPRSREGSDIWIKSALLFHTISIHAPAKGATDFRVFSICLIVFQSTLPRRERPARNTPQKKQHQFQSTLPRRERLP